jgi:hypothetical protein
MICSEDHLKPEDLLYYAPPSVRRGVRATSSVPTKSGRPTSSPSRFDHAIEQPLAASPVAKSIRHRLEPEVADEPDERRLLFVLATRFAAVIGVFAMVGILLLIFVPKSVGSNAPRSAGAARIADKSQRLLEKFVQLQTPPGNSQDSEPVGAPPEDSRALLEKFVQWHERK